MKKNLKRVISALLVLVMMVSLLPANVFAAEETKNATINVESVSAAPGATVDVQISIKDNPGILGARLSVAFDDGLTLVGASNGDAFSVLTMTKPGKLVSPCQFVWDGQDITNEDIKDGVILTLTFAVAPDAVSGVTQNIHISYKYGDFVDANLKKLVIDMVDGGVAVADYVPGDTNKDQEVTPADIIMLRRYLAGGYDLDINVAAGDVNADEELTPADVILIRRYLAGGYDIELLPSPLAGVKPCEHTLQAVAYKAPTETEAGNIAYWRCTTCGKLFSDAEGKNRIALEDTVIPATGQIGENEYRINYILNPTGDEYLASVSITNPNPPKNTSSKRLRLKEPSVPGYTFEGWYDGSGKNAAQVKVLEAGITEEIDLYARWSKIEYKVFYDNSSVENENSGDKPFDTYTVDTGLLLPKPSIDRYVFLGWTDDSDTIISRIPSGTTGNITLHANWTSKRNLAVPVKKLADPIIVEDTDEGKIMFAYEIGEIQNVPLYLLQELVSAGGIVSVHRKTVTSSISTTDAKTISQAINEATTDSTAWTLGSDWNTTTSLDETVLNEHGYTKETGVSLGKTSSNTFTLSTSEYDDTVVNTVDGSTATTTEYDTTTKKGRTSWESKADLSVSDKSSSKYTSSVEAGVSAGLSYGPASVKAEMSAKQSAELSHESSSGASVGTTITHENQEESKTGTDKVTVDQNTTATTTNKGWKKNSESSSTSTTSFSQSQKEALSQRIAEEKHYGESYSSGGSKSDSAAWSTTTGKEEQYTATVTYSEERTTTETAEYTIKGEVDGSYRLVLAGIAHVFAVVTYDIATTEYSVATYSVMDDHTYYAQYAYQRVAVDFWRGDMVSVISTGLMLTFAVAMSTSMLFSPCGFREKIIALALLLACIFEASFFAYRTMIFIIFALIVFNLLRWLCDASVEIKGKTVLIVLIILLLAAVFTFFFLNAFGSRDALLSLKIVRRLLYDNKSSRFRTWGEYLSSGDWLRYPFGGQKSEFAYHGQWVHNLWLDILNKVGLIPFVIAAGFTVTSIRSACCTAVRMKRLHYSRLSNQIASLSLGAMLICMPEPIIDANPYFFFAILMLLGGIKGLECLSCVNDRTISGQKGDF